MKHKVETERLSFKELVIDNPNYFGTLAETELAPVAPMQGNTSYEELRCIGFNPEQDLLEAVLDVKRAGGYKGDLCSTGSYEYVRFFVDWDGDGDFDDPDEDVGMVSVNVHDIPDSEDPCRDREKPLSYALRLQLDPEKHTCKEPNLVKVRAILSWDVPPPAGMPNQPPVWGNVLEGTIQIGTRDWLVADLVKAIDFEKLQISPAILDDALPVSKVQAVSPAELKEVYQKYEVPEHRYNLETIAHVANQIKHDPSLMLAYQDDPAYSALLDSIKAILAAKAETKYEELGCVGLLYDQDTLAATLTVKLPYGYSGDLCSDGSREYVAFWARVYDQIEQQCVWRYLGTSSVNVHDIAEIPSEGLQYAVTLPFDLSSLKRNCHEPVVIQVRAVLSWQTPPSTTNPYDTPTWGNVVESLIQLKPAGITPGQQKPFIWSVGEMAVESIAGNPYTTLGSALGDGYANGPSVGGGFSAVESPFGGTIKITGTITHAPNNPAEIDKLRYKVQYRKVGVGTIWRDITNTFRIWLRIDGVPSGHLDQMADTAGYYKYQKDLTLPVLVEVQDDVLAQWKTPVPEGDGLYLLRVLLYKPGAPAVPGVPADHVSSEIIKVRVDNTPPVAKLSLDAGPCTKFEVGDTFTGKFTATDDHIWHYRLSVLPSVATPPVVSPTGQTYPLLAPPGKVDEPYSVTTTASTTPCGYVLYLHVRDRAIVNNHFPGNAASASVGLCLLEEEA